MCHFLSSSWPTEQTWVLSKKGKFLCQKAAKVRHNCPWEYNSLIFMWLSTALRWIAVGTNAEIYTRSSAALPAIFPRSFHFPPSSFVGDRDPYYPLSIVHD